MSMPKKELRELSSKISQLIKQEETIRQEMKSTYDILMSKFQDQKDTLRHLRQIYFYAQKARIGKLIKERMEFHPFFTAAFNSSEDDE